ncbi:MAG: DKNYY domain-containing protein [Bacteroidota bacterium]
MKIIYSLILIVAINTISCSQKTVKASNGNHNSMKCSCPTSYEMNEISKLIHIKNQFYKNEKGHLYIKTSYPLKPSDDTSPSIPYFSSLISQEIDVETFIASDESLTFIYAKDKNNIYYCQPTSSGDHIWLIKNADVKTFKQLNTIINLFAMDKNNIYEDNKILAGFDPNKTEFKRNKEGQIIEFVQGKLRYKIE